MNATDITNLISALRAETEKQSISPESVGYLLQTLLDFLTNIDETLQTSLTGLSIIHNTDKVALTEAITTLETKVSNINKALSNKKTELEKCIGVLAFDGYVDTQEDAEGEDIGTVWYSTGQSCFVVVEDTGISNSCVHNDSAKDWSQPRMDCLFSSTGQLLVFDGEDLVNWEPELMRDDITDLGDALSEIDKTLTALQESVTTMSEAYDGLDTSINEHIAEVAIYAFNGDGPPSTSSSAYNGPAGIYYSQSEGLFYKTTSGSPSKSIPHNANGKARTDCLYRKGNVLYQYNGSTLSEYVSPSVAAELAELRSLIANLG
ncbi:MAG: hypothetical protein IKL83_04005 [Muribaculaceae bacterium]|nr:hypothetical protein [Muribaculaceae bacterium]